VIFLSIRCICSRILICNCTGQSHNEQSKPSPEHKSCAQIFSSLVVHSLGWLVASIRLNDKTSHQMFAFYPNIGFTSRKIIYFVLQTKQVVLSIPQNFTCFNPNCGSTLQLIQGVMYTIRWEIASIKKIERQEDAN
jgi:hypothetical protein